MPEGVWAWCRETVPCLGMCGGNREINLEEKAIEETDRGKARQSQTEAERKVNMKRETAKESTKWVCAKRRRHAKCLWNKLLILVSWVLRARCVSENKRIIPSLMITSNAAHGCRLHIKKSKNRCTFYCFHCTHFIFRLNGLVLK